MLVNAGLLVLPTAALLLRIRSSEQMGFTLPQLKHLILALALGLVCIPLSYYPIYALLVQRSVTVPWIESARLSFMRTLPFLIVGAALEELFFRGFIISMFLPLGRALSVSISSIAHYLSHFINPGFRILERPADKIIGASGWFITSILLAVLFTMSGSLIPVIVAHLIASIGFGYLITFRSS